MINIIHEEVVGLEPAIRGMRNPMNSWDRSDSYYPIDAIAGKRTYYGDYILGENDLDLMNRLAKGGSVHAKYRRMIVVYLDIVAPLYWWKEFDTYKVGTVANSCSTMHKIHEKEFTPDDFSHEHLFTRDKDEMEYDDTLAAISIDGNICYYSSAYFIQMACNILNHHRKRYLETKDKRYWWQMIQLLPSSYNQRRTVMLSYEVLVGIYKHRKNHKLDEWRDFCKWIENLPYSEIITGDNKEERNEEDV